MKFIGEYKELCPNHDVPSMKEFFEKANYKGKEKIVQYLKEKGTVELAAAGLAKDVFTNEKIPFQYVSRQDGEFYWFTDLAYYVEKYNLRLPIEFETHILTQ